MENHPPTHREIFLSVHTRVQHKVRECVLVCTYAICDVLYMLCRYPKRGHTYFDYFDWSTPQSNRRARTRAFFTLVSVWLDVRALLSLGVRVYVPCTIIRLLERVGVANAITHHTPHTHTATHTHKLAQSVSREIGVRFDAQWNQHACLLGGAIRILSHRLGRRFDAN